MRLKNKTFTLIEMLIVIVIIGILAAALVPRLQSVQGRARDTKRKVDLRNIATALEVYRIDNNAYPPYPGTYPTWTNSSNAQPWIMGLTNYITSLPVDPINTGSGGPWAWTNGTFTYTYGEFDSGLVTFQLIGQLENSSDPDRCGVKIYKRSGLGNQNAARCPSNSNNIYGEGPYRFGIN